MITNKNSGNLQILYNKFYIFYNLRYLKFAIDVSKLTQVALNINNTRLIPAK